MFEYEYCGVTDTTIKDIKFRLSAMNTEQRNRAGMLELKKSNKFILVL